MADLAGLIGRLLAHKVDFVIVGGFAAIAHGTSTVTQDVDICCCFDPENLMRLYETIKDLHPVHRMTPQKLPLVLTPETCRPLQNLYLNTDLGPLDCLSTVLGVGDFDQVKQNSCQVELPNGPCRILDLDALIESKKALNRERDRQTLRQLEGIREHKKGTQ